MPRPFLFLLLANLLFGLGVIFMLPPFEGADEAAHYSRIKSEAFAPQARLAATDKLIDDNVNQRIAGEVIDYQHLGPMAHGWIALEVKHGNDPLRNQLVTYYDFFKDPARVADYMRQFRQMPLETGYRSSLDLNWEYQHPGLYYAVMGAAMKLLAGHIPLVTAILVLRMLSYFLAFAGLSIGVFGTYRYLTAKEHPQAAFIAGIGLLCPFLLPEYFWEFTRIGNDSLCLFLFGIAWSMLLRFLRKPQSDAWLYLGMALGFGCLTKALMLPVSTGVMGFLIFHHVCVVRNDPVHRKDWWVATLKTGALLLLITAPVYLPNIMVHGQIGAGEFSNALHQAGAMHFLVEQLSWAVVTGGLQQIFYIFIWVFGGESFIVLDLPIHKLLYFFTALVGVAYLVALRRVRDPIWQMPLWVILPVLAGLLAHVVVALLVVDTYTPGYYLHILAPAFALIYGAGLCVLMNHKISRFIVMCCCAVIVLLNFVIAGSYMTAFSGCVELVRNGESLSGRLFWLHPSDILACAGKFNTVIDHLAVLAWPDFALVSFGLTFVALVLAAMSLRSGARSSSL